MCALEVSLFDISRQALVPVENGCVIWVRTELPSGPWAALPLAAARSLVAFHLLQRVLEYEGLSGRFVIESSDGHNTFLKGFGELEPREARSLHDDPGGRRFAAQGRRVDPRIEIIMPGESAAGAVTPGGRSRAQPGARGAAEHEAPATAGEVVDEYSQPVLLMYLLGRHYSEPLPELALGLREARARVERIREVAATLDANSPGPEDLDEHMQAFRKALAKDLGTPGALRVMFEWLREAELRADRIGDSHLHEMLGLLAMDDVLEGPTGQRRP
jgi:hypothetical protein